MTRNFGVPIRNDLDRDANDDLRAMVIAGLIAAVVLVVLALIWLASMLISWPAHAGDPTGFWHREIAAGRAPKAEWWNGLEARGGGLCCSHADGLSVKDVDWDTKDGHYRVYARGWIIDKTTIPDGWIDVPDVAIVKDPNLYGQAVVWPYLAWRGIKENAVSAAIRCFMPGVQG